jgi:hypothetical protein
MSMADALPGELMDVQELAVQIGYTIRTGAGIPFVRFEHGQRNEDENPFGCTITHAHLHVVGTELANDLELDSLPEIRFMSHNGGVLSLHSETGGRHYLYVQNMDGQAWLAMPDHASSQVLRRHFLEARAHDRELKWNWSDQVLLRNRLETRERVLMNLGLLKGGAA